MCLTSLGIESSYKQPLVVASIILPRPRGSMWMPHRVYHIIVVGSTVEVRKLVWLSSNPKAYTRRMNTAQKSSQAHIPTSLRLLYVYMGRSQSVPGKQASLVMKAFTTLFLRSGPLACVFHNENDMPRLVNAMLSGRIPRTSSTLKLHQHMSNATNALALCYPEGPSTQYLRTPVPKTMPLMAFGTRVLKKNWVLGPSGLLKIQGHGYFDCGQSGLLQLRAALQPSL